MSEELCVEPPRGPDHDIIWEMFVEHHLKSEELSQAQKVILREVWEHSKTCKPTTRRGSSILALEWDHTETNHTVLTVWISHEGKVEWYFVNHKTGDCLSTHNNEVPAFRPVFWELLKETLTDADYTEDTGL